MVKSAWGTTSHSASALVIIQQKLCHLKKVLKTWGKVFGIVHYKVAKAESSLVSI